MRNQPKRPPPRTPAPANWKAIVESGVPSEFKPQTSEFDDLLDLWQRNIDAFARSFDIVDKDLQRVNVIPSPLQTEVLRFISKHNKALVLKGRQIWVTTSVVFFVLRECLFRPGIRVCVAVHDDRAAMEIGKFYVQLYEMHTLLPTLLPRTNKHAHSMVFENGSQILFGTANSEFWRGFPTHLAHLTEAAMYDNLGRTLASLGQTVPKSGRIILETTANGENAFYQLWDDEHGAYAKLFLSWLQHPEYVSNAPLPETLSEFEAEFIAKYKLPLERASWWVEKYRSLPIEERALVGQEYPPTPEVAFILSGDKFLKVPVPVPLPLPVDQDGITRILDFDPTHQYAAGVDAASGSTSSTADASTLVIGDLTTRTVAATMQAWLPTPLFSKVARRLLADYHDPVTAVEISGGFGLDIARNLREMGVPMYLQAQYRGVADRLAAQHGWDTNLDTRPILYGGIFTACNGQPRWMIGCRRLVTELNALAYNKAKRPEAPKNKHDDMATAFGCMIQACPQAHPAERAADEKHEYESPIQREWRLIQERGMAAVNAMRSGSDVRPQPGDFYD